MKTTPARGICLLLFVLLCSCTQEREYFPAPEYSGGWRRDLSRDFVERRGLAYEVLQELGQYSQSLPNVPGKMHDYGNHVATIVIKDGWIVGEWYNLPEAMFFQQYLASNGKSFAYVLFGMMKDEAGRGTVPPDLDENSKLYDSRYLAEGFPLSDPRKEAITFEQVFRHQAGFIAEADRNYSSARNRWSDYGLWVLGRDPHWPALGQLIHRPGHPEEYSDIEHWGANSGAYSSVGFAHLGLVFQNLYQMPPDRLLWEKLLGPLGFSGISYHFPMPGRDRWQTGGGLCMISRDYARFAYFLMKKGRWKERQLVAPQWIERCFLTPYYQNMRSNADGYFGGHLPKDLLRIYGAGGNFAFILPSQNLIVLRCARTSNEFVEEAEREVLRRLPALLQKKGLSQARTAPIPFTPLIAGGASP